MSDEGYAFLIMGFVLLVILIIGVFLYYKKSSELIEPSRCPVINGVYGANPGKAGSSVFSCGKNGVSECTFNNINTLTDAQNLCNNYLNVCTAFSYSPSLGVVRFVNRNLVASTTFDTYILQHNTTIE